jgi:RNA polymerase sigma factor (sigma-70 family)
LIVFLPDHQNTLYGQNDMVPSVSVGTGCDLFNEASVQGGPEYLDLMYNKYFPKVYSYCLSFSRNRDDAFDMAQDVFLKAISHIESFEGASAFSTWLFSITRNHCISEATKRSRVRFEEVHLAAQVPADDNLYEEFEERLANEALEEDLDHFMDLLPEYDRMLLTLKYREKYSVKELQRAFNLSTSAVKMRLYRARRRMEEIIEVTRAA